MIRRAEKLAIVGLAVKGAIFIIQPPSGFFRRDLATRKGRNLLSPRPKASQPVSNSFHRCSSGSAVWLTGNSMTSQGAVKCLDRGRAGTRAESHVAA
jgi:hypothetical protein